MKWSVNSNLLGNQICNCRPVESLTAMAFSNKQKRMEFFHGKYRHCLCFVVHTHQVLLACSLRQCAFCRKIKTRATSYRSDQ